MQKLKLYLDAFWISPYSFAAFVALKEKQIPFETVDIALQKGDQKTPAYQKSTITGKIPAIQNGDFWLAESGAIIDYLEDAFPSPKHPAILPKDIEMKARARMVLAWIRSSRDLMPLIAERSTETMYYKKATTPLTEKAQASANKLIEASDRLISPKEKNLFGEWCIADSDLAFCLHRLIINDHAVPEKIKKFAELHWSRPSVQEFNRVKRSEYVSY